MNEDEKTVEKKRKTVHIELSFLSLFFWGIGFVFCLAWIFALGVLAGKGLLPGGAETLGEIKTQMTRIQEMIVTEKAKDVVVVKEQEKEPNLAFYHELSKGVAPPPKRSAPPVPAPKIPKEKETVSEPVKAGRFVVQVASLDDEKKAAAMVERLTSRGYKAYFYKTFVKGRPFYRVRCGLFGSEEEAKSIQSQLAQKERLQGFVKKVLKGDE